jgi:hypothetical protein
MAVFALAVLAGAAGILFLLRSSPRDEAVVPGVGRAVPEPTAPADLLPPTAPAPPTTHLALEGRGAASDMSVPPDLVRPMRRAPVEAWPRAPQPRSKDAFGSPVRVHLVLDDGGRDGEEIAITAVATSLVVISPDSAGVRQIPSLPPGSQVVLSTADPRAALRSLAVTAPDPMPPDWTVRMPPKGDPSLRRLVLRVVDSGTGEPLPDAVLEWGDESAPVRVQHADEGGRIEIEPPAGSDLTPLEYFVAGETFVRAPGHAGYGHTRGSSFWRVTAASDNPSEAGIAEIRRNGTLTIRLPAYDASQGWVSREVRTVDESGAPVAGAYLLVAPLSPEAGRPLEHGFRITDARGIVRLDVRDGALVAWRVNASFLKTWTLSHGDWPARGPLDLVLPDVSDVEVVVDGIPEGVEGTCSVSLPMPAPPEDGADRPVGRFLPPAGGQQFLARLAAPTATAHAVAPLGEKVRFDFRTATETRALTVEPAHAGPLRMHVFWEDLTVTERGSRSPSGFSISTPVPDFGSAPPR